jgi:AcrR family transcriptional regulator
MLHYGKALYSTRSLKLCVGRHQDMIRRISSLGRKPSATKTLRERSKKDIVLDAAEHMFAHKGYHGASVRDIFRVAEVSTGLMTYYFSSKEDLFTQAVTRKLEDFRSLFHRMMDEVSDGENRVFEVFNKYIYFFFFNAFCPETTMKDYTLLLANCASVYDEQIVSEVFEKFDFIFNRTFKELKISNPDLDDDKIRATIFYLESAVTTIMLTDRFREKRLGATNAAALDRFILNMAEFYADGLTGKQAH